MGTPELSDMAQLIGLLRGVNVASHNRIAMADLRRIVEGLGYENPRTLVQSGNVVFGSSDAAGVAASRIEEALGTELGLDVPVIVRTRAELAKVVERNPFAEIATQLKMYYVIFLSEKPDAKALGAIDAATYEPEVFEAHGREVYVWFPEGMHRAKLGHAFWEKRLKVTATARNWNTVQGLLEMASE
jgi:uncharacterized protein (DUF1697 family)